MVKHCVPGGNGDSKWFYNLCLFQRSETIRQVKYKNDKWPGLPDGVWSKRKTYSYPHILPEGHLDKAFYSPIFKDVLSYCGEEIEIHSEALNLKSSQVSCFNVLFPLKEDLKLAKVALTEMLPGVESIERIEFEYTGAKDAKDIEPTKWLGEPLSGKRGQNRTSIDAAIWWRRKNKSVVTLIEWKYTEKGYGTCGGYESKGNKDKDYCRNLMLKSSILPAKCYLISSKHNRNYWNLLAASGIDIKTLSAVNGCPFKGPFYQIMRQFLLAQYLRHAKIADEVDVALWHFGENKSVTKVPGECSSLGSNIIDAWNKCLQDVPRLKSANIENIAFDKLKADHSKYLIERYGLGKGKIVVL
jgi:hypothetical protein